MLLTAAVRQPTLAANGPQQPGGYKLTGPYTYENLTIFLIHGQDKIDGKNILTLQEAMDRKLVIVYETQSVNELAIENLSPTDEVYVQSGDIVKGGQQDRVLAVDLIVPPKSGRLKIDAFCVESGRWTKRGSEEAGKFSSSSDQLVTKDLRLAAKQANNQSQVWDKVAETQAKLSSNVGVTVNAAQSESSLQLALENKQVQQTADNYIKKLSNLPFAKERSDVIGYVFAINGKINSADVYASHTLFMKLWPKLLKANAIEAIAELQKGKRFEPVTITAVKAFILEAQSGTATEQSVTTRIKIITRETPRNITFETRDTARKGLWVHINYVVK
jgi:hypothetical protein